MFARTIHLASALGAFALLLTGIGVIHVAAAQPSANAAATHRILIAGDSTTQGSSGDYTWRYRLWNKLAQTAPSDVAFVGPRTDLYDNVNNTQGSQHYAVDFAGKAHGSAWGAAYVTQLDNVAAQVTSSGANVLVVMLGLNDLAFHTTPAQTIANAESYIQRARAAAPGLDVVIGEVTHRYDFFGDAYVATEETDEYASLLAGLAADLNTSSERVVVAHTKDGWDPRIHTWDGSHPNSTGETLIAQRVSEGLAQLGIGAASPSIFQTTDWSVGGPTPGVSTGLQKATVSWSRVSTGATAMFVHHRLTNANQAWQRLPYAVSQTDSWTMEPLRYGGTYDFAVSPSKGFMTGIRGSATRRTIPAKFGLVLQRSTAAYGQATTATATVSSTFTTPTGSVLFTVGGKTLTKALSGGRATVRLPALTAGKTYAVKATYKPSSTAPYPPGSATRSLRVVADSTRTTVLAPDIRRGRKARAGITVKSVHGKLVTGKVEAKLFRGARQLGKVTVTLSGGKASVVFARILRIVGTGYKVTAKYLPTTNFKSSIDSDPFRVTRQGA